VLSFADPLPHRPQRVLVAGVSGAGKTTLAARIALVTGGAHTEIDGLFHGAGWIPRDEFLDDVRSLAATASWTTEWQYSTARPLLADSADLLGWLDLPFWRVTFWRLVGRTIRRRTSREVLWNGNVEQPLWCIVADRNHIVRWGIRTRQMTATQVRALETTHPDLTVVRLRTNEQVEAWVAGPLTGPQLI
jgi:adenylate kinase family enzyme